MLRICLAAVLLASTSAFHVPTPSLHRVHPTSFRVSRTLSDSCLGTKVHRGRAASALSALQAEVQLFGSRSSRSPLVEWYLKEIGQPYTHRDDLENNPNPFGQIPGMSDGGVEIFESGAMLLYVADKYGGLNTPEDRADASKWVLWANAALAPALFSADIEARAPGLLDKLNEILEGKSFLVDGKFSVADVAVASYLLFIPLFFPGFDVSRFPNVCQYMERCVQRPTYKETFPGAPRAAEYVAGQVAKIGKGPAKKSFGFF